MVRNYWETRGSNHQLAHILFLKFVFAQPEEKREQFDFCDNDLRQGRLYFFNMAVMCVIQIFLAFGFVINRK